MGEGLHNVKAQMKTETFLKQKLSDWTNKYPTICKLQK